MAGFSVSCPSACLVRPECLHFKVSFAPKFVMGGLCTHIFTVVDLPTYGLKIVCTVKLESL